MDNTKEPLPTPRYTAIIEAANRIASEKGGQHVGAEHLFLAIIRDRAGVPTQVLAQLVNLDHVKAQFQAVMESKTYNTPSRRIMPPEQG
jgi:ATP-dependent Clp protease ATP-binding subunit ClpA